MVGRMFTRATMIIGVLIALFLCAAGSTIVFLITRESIRKKVDKKEVHGPRKKQRPVPTQRETNTLIASFLLFGYSLLTLIATFFTERVRGGLGITGTWNWAEFFLVLAIGFLAWKGWWNGPLWNLKKRAVQPDECAVITFFGRPIGLVQQGFIFTGGICNVDVLSQANIVDDIGTAEALRERERKMEPRRTNGEESEAGGTSEIILDERAEERLRRQLEEEVAEPKSKWEGDTPTLKPRQLWQPFHVLSANFRTAVWDGDHEEKRDGAKKWIERKSPDSKIEKYPEDHPLNHTLDLNPKIKIIFRIKDPLRSVRWVGDERKIRGDLAEVVRTVVQDIFGKRTVMLLQSHLDEVCLVILAQVERYVGDDTLTEESYIKKFVGYEGIKLVKHPPEKRWGIDIIAIRIEQLGIPKRVNLEAAAASASGFRRESMVNLGKGEAAREREVGLAKAAVRQANLEAEAAGRAQLAKTMETEGGRELARLEALRETVREAKLVITPASGTLDLFGATAAVKTALDQLGDGKGGPPAPSGSGKPPPKT